MSVILIAFLRRLVVFCVSVMLILGLFWRGKFNPSGLLTKMKTSNQDTAVIDNDQRQKAPMLIIRQYKPN